MQLIGCLNSSKTFTNWLRFLVGTFLCFCTHGNNGISDHIAMQGHPLKNKDCIGIEGCGMDVFESLL